MTDLHPTGRSIPHSLFDSTGIGSQAALAIWKDSMDAIYDVRLCVDHAAFQVRAEAYHFGEVVLTAYRCLAQTFDRSRARIGRDGIDHYTLQFCLSGRHGSRDGAGGAEAGPGDLLIADLAQPHATGTSDFDSLNLTVPRRLLAPLLRAPDEQNLRLVSGSAPLVALFRNHLIGLFAAAPVMSVNEAESLVAPTLAMAAAVLNTDAPDRNFHVIDPLLTAQIHRLISDRAVDPGISAEDIAGRLGISRRKLYYLMEPHGGFTACVRERRLHLAHALLRDPTQHRRSVADIAQSCGFSWRTNFARTFRSRFGLTPREARALAGQYAPSPTEDLMKQHMWEWIQQLR
ncbi:helix-turn-helix domain-containing protein [Sphingomonas sp. MS122]|uniref:helix-turn-helix domain-containing protein n=1 Tax=Sphingomonas sp. MS122 TaxID=3412683 RepID=UPI003C2EB913